eukprot:CAMPEP_0176319334 /NCGR_PEP_ID=MMETSP0121_2-20121125/70249_1 /TAXON_ID=160619 /ORGANISM="Kryptoperidinium foliaceum, Strain CCMP 1326" /LENGTH=51 /DNA_ID=CAMNT_0017661681 /DNA_START=35 /DNA_END=186 /DNA_ORIENTATION=-
MTAKKKTFIAAASGFVPSVYSKNGGIEVVVVEVVVLEVVDVTVVVVVVVVV